MIRPETREFLLALAAEGEAEGVGLYHASPRDPIWEYVLSGLTAELCLDAAPQRVSLIGHSHVALSFHRPEGEPATGSTRRDGDLLDIGDGRVAAQPRLAGQPRDGDPRAAWLILDTDGLDGGVAARRVRPRRRPGRDPRRAAAGLARRAAAVRAVTGRRR